MPPTHIMIPAIVPADAAVPIDNPTVAARMAQVGSTPTIKIAVFSLFGLRKTATAIASATAGIVFIPSLFQQHLNGNPRRYYSLT